MPKKVKKSEGQEREEKGGVVRKAPTKSVEGEAGVKKAGVWSPRQEVGGEEGEKAKKEAKKQKKEER
eukprot:scaffold43774_cov12-Tisochrysis_lutea.AAC.1